MAKPRTVTLISIAAVAIALRAAAASTDFMSELQPRFGFHQVTLYSWQVPNGGYQFVLIPEAAHAKFFHQFSRTDRYIGDVSELKKRLLLLPRDTFVAWRTNRENGCAYPPQPIIDDVKAFAGEHHLKLEVIPTVYE